MKHGPLGYKAVLEVQARKKIVVQKLKTWQESRLKFKKIGWLKIFNLIALKA